MSIDVRTTYLVRCDVCRADLAIGTDLEQAVREAMTRGAYAYIPAWKGDALECLNCKARREVRAELATARIGTPWLPTLNL